MNYELKFNFGIDEQQLHDLSPQEVFVLGFEFSTIFHLLNQPSAFSMVVRARNSPRIRSYARVLNRKVSLGHVQHGWRKLVAEEATSSGV